MQTESDEQEVGQALAEEQLHGGERRDQSPYAILRNRDYGLYLLARNISVIGQRVTATAIGWDLYTRTHDAMALAYVGLVQFIPVLLLAIPAGDAADRYGRRQIVLAAQMVMAACALGLAAVSALHAPPVLVYIPLFFAGVARGFSGPATASMLPQFVPREQYESAIKWSTSAFQSADITSERSLERTSSDTTRSVWPRALTGATRTL